MLRIDKILYPTDFSDTAAEALPHALHLAEKYGAELHMLHAHVLHESDPINAAHSFPRMQELYDILERNAEDQMDAALERYPTELKIERVQVRGISAPTSILEYSEQQAIDLIVMGTHGRRGLRRLLLGSVAEEIVRLAPCPVLTVPERDRVPAGRFEKIVVPVDFSEYAALALTYAHELAAVYAAQLLLLHIVDEVVYPDFYPPVMPSGGRMTDELGAQSVTRLRELLAETGRPDVRADVHVRSGKAAPEIAHFTESEAADLVVIASHGLTGLSHMLLGSVTEQVIRRAHCPVFTVKAFGRKVIAE